MRFVVNEFNFSRFVLLLLQDCWDTYLPAKKTDGTHETPPNFTV